MALPVDFFQLILLPSLASIGEASELEQDSHLAWLRHHLAESKSSLLKLLDFPGPNAEEKRQLSAPNYVLRPPRRSPQVIQQRFVEEALFLSSNVGLSELLSAYLVSASFDNVRIGVSNAEAAAAIFHHERLAKLQSLEWIFQHAKIAQHEPTSALTRDLASFARSLLSQVEAGKSFVDRILDTVDAQTVKIQDLLKPTQPAAPTFGASAPVASTSAARFDDHTQQQRINWHVEEREHLGAVLYQAAASHLLSKADIKSIATWLSTQADPGNNDKALRHVLLAVMAALRDPLLYSTKEGDLDEYQRGLFTDNKWAKEVHAAITKEWKLRNLRGALLLQWTLFLAAARTYVPDLVDAGRHFLDEPWQEAVKAGAFVTLRKDILGFQQRSEVYQDELRDRLDLSPPDELDYAAQKETSKAADEIISYNVASWLRAEALDTVENVVLSIANRMRDRVKKLKLAQEDMPALGRGTLTSRRAAAAIAPPEKRHDIEDLLLLIASVYRNRPNSALVFWGDRQAEPWVAQKAHLLSKLLSDVKTMSMQHAYLDFLAAISEGDEVAMKGFELLGHESGQVSVGVSWANLYQSLEHVKSETLARREVDRSVLVFLRTFLRLLATVVAYSPAAKLLAARSRYQPLSILAELASLPLPVDFKAVLLDTLAAFCAEGQGSVDIVQHVWALVEQYQVLRTVQSSSPQSGIGAELEEVEKSQQIYPATVAFISLLCGLVRPPAKDVAQQSSAEVDSHSVPEQLGAGHREPGIGPFVRFVAESVLIPISSTALPFRSDSEKWRVIERGLTFVEDCLRSLDFQPYMSGADSSGSALPASMLLAQPGFDILVRLLAQPPLLSLLLHILLDAPPGQTVVDQLQADHIVRPSHAACVLRSLRILLRVFELQPVFLEYVLPALFQPGAVRLSNERMSLLRGVNSLDLQLSWRRDTAAGIASLVELTGDGNTEAAIVLSAVRLVHQLSTSPHFDASAPHASRLADLVRNSGSQNRIINAFRDLLDRTDDPALLVGGLDTSIKTNILDLLLVNTTLESAAPNIAHLLLGFSLKTRRDAVEVYDQTQGRYALHAILDMLRPGAVSDGVEADLPPPLVQTDPGLAQKAYRLIRQLCAQDYTASAVMRFLRANGDLFSYMADSLPFGAMPSDEAEAGELRYDDDTSLRVRAADLVAVLHAQAAAVDSIALELNTLANAPADPRLRMLVLALFGSPDLQEIPDDMHWRESALQSNDQSRARILEIFYALLFGWSEAVSIDTSRLNHLRDLSYDSCLQVDEDGCDVYDFSAIFALLARARRNLAQQGALSSPEQKQAVREEAAVVVDILSQENNRRKIDHARTSCLRAWRNVLNTTLLGAFNHVPIVERQGLLLELLNALLMTLSRKEAAGEVAELLASTAVLLLHKLRLEAPTLGAAGDLQIDAAGSVALLGSILRSSINAILQPGSSAVVRGNLYALLLCFVGYARDVAALDEPSSSRSIAGDLLPSATTALLSQLDRLLRAISVDALTGVEAWQSVAYNLLASLVRLAPNSKLPSRIIADLSRRAYLRSFLESIRDSKELNEVCSPRPAVASFNAKFIYEAKMAFLTAVAKSTEGAERLLDADAITLLAQSTFLATYDAPDSMLGDDEGSYLSSAMDRRTELETVALELACAILGGVGRDNKAALAQASNFADAHKEVLLAALRRSTSAPSRKALREAQLVACLLRYVLPSVADESLALPSGFGSLHRAVQSLATSVLGDIAAFVKIQPESAEERREAAQTMQEPRSTSTAFEQQLTTAVDDLTISVLLYLRAATEPGDQRRFRPVLSSSLRSEGPGRSPSLADVLHFLQRSTENLLRRLDDFNEVVAQLADRERPGNDGMLVGESTASTTELRMMRQRAQDRVAASLHMIEAALVLLWRHLTRALGPQESSGGTTLGGYRPLGTAATAAAAGQVADPVSLKREVAKLFSSVTGRLNTIKLTRECIGARDVRSHEALLETLTRTLVDIVSL